ncbi:MAG: TIGR04283 family arsenosugar biosynthesis glycosyltransferase [Ferruginibacter sp.]|nr:TIGR04283 family arsenosugar biosynthesis glycosyltransferase [Chitinophagaceae bacterium]
MKISIIIPTYREENNITRLVNFLNENGKDGVAEIIVADGGSDDHTLQYAADAGARAVVAAEKGRGIQMNFGAALATGDIFYFVHADVLPPPSFAADIIKAVREGYEFGRYSMKFDSRKWYLRINEFFTRFDFFVCYGGDQTLFITRELFDRSGGFTGSMHIMEDFEFTKRVRKHGRYKIFNKGALISARKYDTNSWWRVQMANKKIVSMYKKGASQEDMVRTYRAMLNYR